jgi:hypothetical protein
LNSKLSHEGKKKSALTIQVRHLKRRKGKIKVDPKLGGQWKEKEKVLVLGGQWKVKEKVPVLGGQWKVPNLVANGRWKKNPFHPFSLSPLTKFT